MKSASHCEGPSTIEMQRTLPDLDFHLMLDIRIVSHKSRRRGHCISWPDGTASLTGQVGIEYCHHDGKNCVPCGTPQSDCKWTRQYSETL